MEFRVLGPLQVVDGERVIGITFVRISTHPRALERPLGIGPAWRDPLALTPARPSACSWHAPLAPFEQEPR